LNFLWGQGFELRGRKKKKKKKRRDFQAQTTKWAETMQRIEWNRLNRLVSVVLCVLFTEIFFFFDDDLEKKSAFC
jgi:hypothetical protein